MLDINWYYTIPIDFEYKNYILLSYLSEIDKSFAIGKLSPYLLHTEKLIKELKGYEDVIKKFNFKKEIKSFNWKDGIIYSEEKPMKEIILINEIVEYSIPLLEYKIVTGYKLFKKYPQLLY